MEFAVQTLSAPLDAACVSLLRCGKWSCDTGLFAQAAAPSTTMGSDLRATLEGLRALSAECVDMVELLLAGDSAAAALAATHSERAERTARQDPGPSNPSFRGYKKQR